MSLTLRQADTVERRECPAARIGAAGQLQRQHHVFERRERGHQMKRLEYKADALRPQARATVLIESAKIGTREPNPAGGRRIKARQQREQCGLSGARGADDRNRLSCCDV